MHTLDLSHTLPLDNLAQADGTVLLHQLTYDLPFHPGTIGLCVFLPEEPLISDSKGQVEEVVEKRVMN